MIDWIIEQYFRRKFNKLDDYQKTLLCIDYYHNFGYDLYLLVERLKYDN